MKNYKKMLCLFLIFNFLFIFNNKVEAETKIKVYAGGKETELSNACKSIGGNCLGTEGFSAGVIYDWDFKESAVYGVRVTIVDKDNNIKAGPVNFWANPNMKTAVDASNFIDKIDSDITNDYRDVYNINVGLYIDCLKKIDYGQTCDSGFSGYAGYLNGITPDNVEAYLNEIYFGVYDKNEVYDYYLKVEPIYVIKHTYNNKSYFYGGTTKDILNFGKNYDSTGKLYTVIGSVNVVTNFIKTVYVDKQPEDTSLAYYSGISIDNISNADLINAYEKNNYNSGLGVGYIKISEYATNNLFCLGGNLFSDQVIDKGGNRVNCSIEFILQNRINLQNKKVISGQLIKSDNPITEGTLTMKCSSYIGNIKYSDYVGDIFLGDTKLWLKNNDADSINLEYNTSSGTYQGSVEYYFPPVYLEYMSGKPVSSGCTNCKFVGYGLVVGFTDVDQSLPFKVNFNGQTFETENGNHCSYDASKQLVGGPEGNDKLMLEFRTTSSNNPFSGKSGEGRKNFKIGKNWKSPVIREAVFELRNDSYNKLKSEPLYIIKLTSSDIVDIREYNLNHSYDYYDGSWENDIYRSKFLSDRNIVKNSNIEWLKNYKVPRFCGDINSDGFVDTTDLATYKLYFAGSSLIKDEWAADVNGDGIIEEEDLDLWKLGELNCRESDV